MNQDFTVQKKGYLSEKKKNSCRGVHLKNKFLHKQWATKKNSCKLKTVGLRCAHKKKPCFVTQTFFRSTAGQDCQNSKWPALYPASRVASIFPRWVGKGERGKRKLKKVLSVTKHGFVFWAQRKPNAKLEIYKVFQDRLTFLNRHMIVWIGWDS